jgi:hypothetical protein
MSLQVYIVVAPHTFSDRKMELLWVFLLLGLCSGCIGSLDDQAGTLSLEIAAMALNATSSYLTTYGLQLLVETLDS